MTTFPKRGLGRKTFTLILLKYGWAAILPIVGLFFIALAPSLAPENASLADRAGGVIAMAGMSLAIVAAALAWLEYSHYTVVLDESTFKTTRGILSIEELGFPYRHVRQAKIMRSVMDQILGVSTLIVSVSNEGSEHVEEITLPWLDKTLAADLEDALLKKSEVEQLHIASSAV